MTQTIEEKREYIKKWRLANKEKISAYQKQYVIKNNAVINSKKAKSRDENRESINTYSRDYYAMHREERLAYAKGYRAGNKAAINKKCKEWRENNPEKQKELSDLWRKLNPDNSKIHCARRRSRKQAVGGKLSRGIVKKLLITQEGKCTYCLVDVSNKNHLDHIIPISRGGANIDSNMQLLCPKCNMKKHTKTHDEYLKVINV